MILNFKIDKKDRVLFLWCSSLRIDNKLDKRINNESKRVKEVDINKINIRSPENINLFKYSINGKPIKPHKDAICINCNQKIESYRLYEISFKNLIESHENRKRNKELFNIYDKINMTSSGIEIIPYMENNNDYVIEKLKKYNYSNFIIPKVILKIYPKIKYDDYLKLKEDSIFCSKTAYVCDICYLDITKYCYMGGANMENILRTMKQGKIGLPILNDNKNKNFNNNRIFSSKFNDYRKNSSNIKNNNNNSNNKFKNKHSRNNLSQNNFFNSKTQDSNNNQNNNSIFNNNNFNNNTFYNNNFNSNNILNNNNSRNKFRPVSSKMNWKNEKNFNNKNNDIYNNENIDKLLDKLLK